jgi:hypothetical protein
LSSSLSEGTSVLEAVGPSMVEKVRVPESHVLPMHREWDKASGPDVKGFGVWRPGTFRSGDMRFIVIPHRAHPIWSTYLQPSALVCCLVPAWRVPYSTVCTFIGSPSDRWSLPPCWFRSGGAILDTRGPTHTIWLLVKSVVFRLLGHNRQPTVPRV